MKKLIALVLALLLVFSLAACGGKDTPAPAPSDGGGGEENPDEDIPDAAQLVSDAFIDPLGAWSQYDELIAQIKAETDFAHRTELMHQAEDILMEDAGCIPVAYYNDFWLQSSKIEGMWHSPYGYWYFMYADIAD